MFVLRLAIRRVENAAADSPVPAISWETSLLIHRFPQCFWETSLVALSGALCFTPLASAKGLAGRSMTANASTMAAPRRGRRAELLTNTRRAPDRKVRGLQLVRLRTQRRTAAQHEHRRRRETAVASASRPSKRFLMSVGAVQRNSRTLLGTLSTTTPPLGHLGMRGWPRRGRQVDRPGCRFSRRMPVPFRYGLNDGR